jgi:hypothetical protein
MALDLNRILFFADGQGLISPAPARAYFSIVDGVVGGQGEGPLHPDAYRSGVVLAGFNPLAVDWVATHLMGFDPARIPLYAKAVEQMRRWMPQLDPAQFSIVTNVPEWPDALRRQEAVFRFRAPAGWRGAAELYGVSTESFRPGPEPLEAISQ